MKVPNVGDHGHITADVLRDAGVTVTGVSEESVTFRFDADLGQNEWPLGMAAYESGRFVEMDGDSE